MSSLRDFSGRSRGIGFNIPDVVVSEERVTPLLLVVVSVKDELFVWRNVVSLTSDFLVFLAKFDGRGDIFSILTPIPLNQFVVFNVISVQHEFSLLHISSVNILSRSAHVLVRVNSGESWIEGL